MRWILQRRDLAKFVTRWLAKKLRQQNRVHPGLLPRRIRLDTPTGRATWLKPKCLQVRFLLQVHVNRQIDRQD